MRPARTVRGIQSLRIQLAPLPPAIASRTLSRSAPAFAASARPSAIPSAITEPIRLFASFAISPWPIGPTWTGRPSVSSTGRQRAYAAVVAPDHDRQRAGPRRDRAAADRRVEDVDAARREAARELLRRRPA